MRGSAARCPAHPDTHASLSVNPGEHGGVVLFCHAGCATEDIVAAMGLTMADLMGEPHVVESYPYHDENGVLRYTVDRYEPKDFRCRPGLPPPAQRILFQLNAIAYAREQGLTVYFVEGEKDVLTLAKRGIPATCNVGGAGKWLDHYADSLAGLDVIVVADNDESGAGATHARQVARGLEVKARTVVLAQTSVGKDVTEALEAGYALENVLIPLEEGDLGDMLVEYLQSKPVRWLWNGYIPYGKVTLFEGDPGDGKSMFTVDLVARATSGAPMPDRSAHDGPLNAIMITSEDDPEDTIKPRLIAAGADQKRVRVITHGINPSAPFNITTDMFYLRKLVQSFDAKLVVIDPLMASLDAGTDSHNDASTRRAIYPLYLLARDFGLSAVVVRHLNKGSGRALYRGGGSIAFVGAARACYSIGRDPEDRERRVLACVKNNLAPEPPSLAYLVENGPSGPYLEWFEGAVELTAQDLVDGIRTKSKNEIVAFLNDVIPEGETMPWRAIVEAGRAAGFTEKQLEYRRAESDLEKAFGASGNRGVAWKRKDSHFRDSSHFRHFPKNCDGVRPEVGSTDLPLPKTPASVNAEVAEVGAISEVAADALTEDERKELDLHASAKVCVVCGTAEGVLTWGFPHYVRTCKIHNPNLYHGGTLEKGNG